MIRLLRNFSYINSWKGNPNHPIEERKVDGQETHHDGCFIQMDVPFGTFCVVSAFSGENTYTLQISGGHYMDYLITVQEVDWPIKIITPVTPLPKS